MNGNSYYITTSFISCNTDSYYSVITIKSGLAVLREIEVSIYIYIFM
jgi:hypothetical protein